MPEGAVEFVGLAHVHDLHFAQVLLGKAGFDRVANLSGGMLRWHAQRFPVEGGTE